MEIELQNKNTDITIENNNIDINLEKEDKDIEIEEKELDVEVETNNVDIELGASTVPTTNQDHSRLYNLSYESSGHKGFQKEMDAITNIEIERMWQSE